MFRIRKIWWAVTLLLISFYMPSKGHALVKRNADYERTILIGRVSFQYSKSERASSNGNESGSSNFGQNYSLNLNGNILNRLLIIYEAGVNYNKQTREHNNSQLEADRIQYHVTTYILPESTIPLTLSAQRTIVKDATSDNYGLNWHGSFQKLPETNLNIVRTATKNKITEWQSTHYTLDLSKRSDKSINIFSHILSETENKTSSTKNSTMVTSFSNQTNISRSTSIGFSAQRGVSKNARAQESSAEGLSASLRSAPTNKFSQSHEYSYSINKSATIQSEAERYTGGINYRFSSNLSSNMHLSVSNNTSESLTFESDTDSITASGGLSYRASEKLSLSESISYTTSNTSGSESGQINLVDVTSLNVKTNARYHTKLSWAKLSTSYSVGYREASSTGGSSANPTEEGAAIDQHFSLGLGGMNAKGYALVNASSGYGYSEALEGDITKSDTHFSIDAQNSIWTEYVKLSASYRKNIDKSWIEANTRERDSLMFRGNTDYLEKYLNPSGNGKTRLVFAANRDSSSNSTTEKTTNTSANISMSHNRIVLRGMLTSSVAYSTSASKPTENKQRTSSLIFNAGYGKPLLRRIKWKAKASVSIKDSGSSRNISSYILNSFIYGLRRWSLSTTHQYSTRKHSRSKSTEHRITFTASRSFIRVF